MTDARASDVADALMDLAVQAIAGREPPDPSRPQHASSITTPQERDEMIAKMQRAKDGFYFMAIHVGDHRFVEFAGMIGEYIKLCERAHALGYDLTELYRDGVMEPYHAGYVGEKIGCIYGSAFFRRPDLMSAFMASVLGIEQHQIPKGMELAVVVRPKGSEGP